MNPIRTPTPHQPTARPTPPVLEPPVMDASVPAPARVWNYWLGGKDHYETDRAAADQYRAVCPRVPSLLRAMRRFTDHTVDRLAAHGHDQYLDLGCGLPPDPGRLHTLKGARVVYLDNDPMVLTHGRALLAHEPQTTVIAADIRDPAFLDTALRPLDPARPIAAILSCLLGHLATTEASTVLQRLRDRLPGGSRIVVTDLITTGTTHLIATKPPYRLRTWRQFAALTHHDEDTSVCGIAECRVGDACAAEAQIRIRR